jgi:hypothetical protein
MDTMHSVIYIGLKQNTDEGRSVFKIRVVKLSWKTG